jgi:hypothetical protein
MARNKHRQLAENFEFPVNDLNEGTMPRNKRRRIADFPMSDVAADRLEAQAIEKMASRTALSMIAVLFVLVALAGAIMWATAASAQQVCQRIGQFTYCNDQQTGSTTTGQRIGQFDYYTTTPGNGGQQRQKVCQWIGQFRYCN